MKSYLLQIIIKSTNSFKKLLVEFFFLLFS